MPTHWIQERGWVNSRRAFCGSIKASTSSYITSRALFEKSYGDPYKMVSFHMRSRVWCPAGSSREAFLPNLGAIPPTLEPCSVLKGAISQGIVNFSWKSSLIERLSICAPLQEWWVGTGLLGSGGAVLKQRLQEQCLPPLLEVRPSHLLHRLRG